jgi:hypothetical protein
MHLVTDKGTIDLDPSRPLPNSRRAHVGPCPSSVMPALVLHARMAAESTPRRVNDDLTKPGQRPLGEIVRNPADSAAKPKRAAFNNGRMPQSPRPRVAGDGSGEGDSVFSKILDRAHSGGPEKSLSSPSQPTAGQPGGSIATFGSTYLLSHWFASHRKLHSPYTLQ